MGLRKSNITRYFKTRDACALFVADGLRQWAVGPATYALTTTIRPGKFGGFCVTFVIKGSSDNIAIQTFLDVLSSIYPLHVEGGLSRSEGENPNAERENNV